MSDLYWLTDEQMARLQPFFPKSHGKPRVDDRRVEFMVDDVDAVFARLKDNVELVHEPKLLPWGNRSLQFRDPEGTVVSLFTPTTGGAKARFGSR